MRILMLALVLSVSAATFATDDYPLIDPTTYPAANPSHSAESAAFTLDAGAVPMAEELPDALDARTSTTVWKTFGLDYFVNGLMLQLR